MRRRHPNLVSYDELDENSKQLDRNQISASLLSNSDQTSKIDLPVHVTIGLIGRNLVNREDINTIIRCLNEDILPELSSKLHDARLEFVTPLAPGSDFIIAQTVREYFKNQPSKYKISIIKCSNNRELVRKYFAKAQTSHFWKIDGSVSSLQIENDQSEIELALNEFQADCQIIEIYHERDASFSRQLAENSNYFASRIDILIAYLGQPNSDGSSNTHETVKKAKQSDKKVIVL